jgi:hypothetical protein
MSAFATAPFAVVAPLLADYGYNPVPIPPGRKGPLADSWQQPRSPSHYLPRHGACGTGILTRNCPAVDLDIRNREIVRVLISLAEEELGPTPFRMGAPPKVILPFSTCEPFEKIIGRWWAMPGDDYRAEGYAAHRIEILCDGQQFVAYAQHPRGTFYRWRRGEPIATPLDGLPPITGAEAKAFLETAEDTLGHLGAIPVKRERGEWVPDVPQPKRKTTQRREAFSPHGWQALEPETLAKAIDAKNARRTKGGWITACPAHRSEGARSLSITPRKGGGSVVHCFAECSFRDISDAIDDIARRAA